MAAARRRYKRKAVTKKSKLKRRIKFFAIRSAASAVLLLAAFIIKLLSPQMAETVTYAVNSNIDVEGIKTSATQIILRYSPTPPAPPETIETSN